QLAVELLVGLVDVGVRQLGAHGNGTEASPDKGDGERDTWRPSSFRTDRVNSSNLHAHTSTLSPHMTSSARWQCRWRAYQSARRRGGGVIPPRNGRSLRSCPPDAVVLPLSAQREPECDDAPTRVIDFVSDRLATGGRLPDRLCD